MTGEVNNNGNENFKMTKALARALRDGNITKKEFDKLSAEEKEYLANFGNVTEENFNDNIDKIELGETLKSKGIAQDRKGNFVFENEDGSKTLFRDTIIGKLLPGGTEGGRFAVGLGTLLLGIATGKGIKMANQKMMRTGGGMVASSTSSLLKVGGSITAMAAVVAACTEKEPVFPQNNFYDNSQTTITVKVNVDTYVNLVANFDTSTISALLQQIIENQNRGNELGEKVIKLLKSMQTLMNRIASNQELTNDKLNAIYNILNIINANIDNLNDDLADRLNKIIEKLDKMDQNQLNANMMICSRLDQANQQQQEMYIALMEKLDSMSAEQRNQFYQLFNGLDGWNTRHMQIIDLLSCIAGTLEQDMGTIIIYLEQIKNGQATTNDGINLAIRILTEIKGKDLPECNHHRIEELLEQLNDKEFEHCNCNMDALMELLQRILLGMNDENTNEGEWSFDGVFSGNKSTPKRRKNKS